jgi:hypothetical protein
MGNGFSIYIKVQKIKLIHCCIQETNGTQKRLGMKIERAEKREESVFIGFDSDFPVLNME